MQGPAPPCPQGSTQRPWYSEVYLPIHHSTSKGVLTTSPHPVPSKHSYDRSPPREQGALLGSGPNLLWKSSTQGWLA